MPDLGEEARTTDAPVHLLTVAELLPVLCAHFGVEVGGREMVIGFASGPETVMEDGTTGVRLPTLNLCVTQIGVTGG